jgi:hypothetical protein
MRNVKNQNHRRLHARFGPEIGFEVKPGPAAALRAEQQARLAGLKDQLLGELLDGVYDIVTEDHFRHAANEAAALAWISPYPLLVFPTLFEEKASEAEFRLERQAEVRQKSRELLAL